MSQLTVQQVGAEISRHLNEIAELFKPGAKLTFVSRSPDFPDGSRDMVLTSDDLGAVIAALEIRRGATP
jgi:hypothetical protein